VAPRLSATLIVRNESSYLDGCLASLHGLADEIVVVDTGSTDDTRDIARAHGARLSEFAWCDDFSAARNFAIDQARGDWLLYIDADERVRAPVDLAALHRLFAEEKTIAATVRFVARTGYTAYRENRLFRRHPAIRFTGAMHETMVPGLQALLAADPEARIAESVLTIDHLGYDGDQSHKLERDLRMLRKQLEQSPERVYLWWHLGKVLHDLGQTDEAEQAWRHGAELAAARGGVLGEDALCFIALARLQLERGEDAGATVEAGLALRPDNLVLHWLSAQVAMRRGAFDEAAAVLARLAAVDPAALVSEAGYDRDILGPGALIDLACLELQRGDDAAAEAAYAEARRREPDHREHEVRMVAARMKWKRTRRDG
jgi:tetratricopeptide (TPR) repeat protein